MFAGKIIQIIDRPKGCIVFRRTYNSKDKTYSYEEERGVVLLGLVQYAGDEESKVVPMLWSYDDQAFTPYGGYVDTMYQFRWMPDHANLGNIAEDCYEVED